MAAKLYIDFHCIIDTKICIMDLNKNKLLDF